MAAAMVVVADCAWNTALPFMVYSAAFPVFLLRRLDPAESESRAYDTLTRYYISQP
jgi:hypothetical protein